MNNVDYNDDGKLKSRALAQVICSLLLEKDHIKYRNNFVQIINDMEEEIKHLREIGEL